MLSRIRALAAGVCLLLAAGSAGAGTLTVTYQITGGSVSLPGFDAPVPFDFGSFTLVYSANGSFSKLSGPASLRSLTLFGYRNYGTANAVHERDFFLRVPTWGGAVGNATAGSLFSAGPGFYFYGSANFHCAGPLCPINGFINSMSYGNIFTGTGGFLSIQGAGTTAMGLGTGWLFDFSGDQSVGSLSFTGQEVSRSYVPEPHSGGLLALGLAGLGVYAAGRRARR